MGEHKTPAHQVDKGDPRTNGPFAEDVALEREEARRQARSAAHKEAVKKMAEAPAPKKKRRSLLDRLAHGE